MAGRFRALRYEYAVLIRERAGRLKLELIAVGLAARHARTPWYAKLIVLGCVVYALAPLDLIPDWIPVIGFIDELIFIPLALAFAVRFVPADVLAECRRRALEIDARLPRLSRPAWLAITAAWVGGVSLIAWWTVA